MNCVELTGLLLQGRFFPTIVVQLKKLVLNFYDPSGSSGRGASCFDSEIIVREKFSLPLSPYRSSLASFRTNQTICRIDPARCRKPMSPTGSLYLSYTSTGIPSAMVIRESCTSDISPCPAENKFGRMMTGIGRNGGGEVRVGGILVPSMAFPGTAVQLYLANCDVDEMVEQPSEVCEAYARYLRLPELSRLQKTRSWPNWPNEPLVRPAFHSLEMIFRLISSILFDNRDYIDREEWLRRLEALANTQLELISHICEGDHAAPTTKQATSSASGPGWQKSTGSRTTPFRSSQESLLPRMATWKKAQSAVTRLHFAIEGHMLRVPWTLGLGEPNLSGKPILDYDKLCTPLEIYANRQSAQEYPEDHALATAHQILEAWLVVAQGLVKCIEERIGAGDTEGAAKKCWILERVWKLCTSTMDLLQVMDPDDFMRLKQELAVKTSGGSNKEGVATSGAAYCLRSSMMTTVTKACKELRRFLPKIVGVEADPKGGPRLQEAVMELFNSHGQRTRGRLDQSRSYHTGCIHLLQAFQAVEAAIRQFFFTYQQLVIIVMGSGEYKGAIQSENSGADVLQQLYSEPPYFPSVDGARTFLGDFWHQHNIMEERLSMRQAAGRKSSRPSSICSTSSSATDSDEDVACSSTTNTVSNVITESDYQRTQRLMFEEAMKSSPRAYHQQQEAELRDRGIQA
ncbi:hypothetical protein R1flu_010073 [Riccia fluitans]|uniref:Nematode resistance protein-like HSPRO2 n=1 Tax=Riccia fluitans TaxID=41844 RepID=A0ABD1Z3Y6_9MARC